MIYFFFPFIYFFIIRVFSLFFHYYLIIVKFLWNAWNNLNYLNYSNYFRNFFCLEEVRKFIFECFHFFLRFQRKFYFLITRYFSGFCFGILFFEIIYMTVIYVKKSTYTLPQSISALPQSILHTTSKFRKKVLLLNFGICT